MKDPNYHERLKKLNMFNLERRRDRYKIIYAWHQIETMETTLKVVPEQQQKS